MNHQILLYLKMKNSGLRKEDIPAFIYLIDAILEEWIGKNPYGSDNQLSKKISEYESLEGETREARTLKRALNLRKRLSGDNVKDYRVPDRITLDILSSYYFDVDNLKRFQNINKEYPEAIKIHYAKVEIFEEEVEDIFSSDEENFNSNTFDSTESKTDKSSSKNNDEFSEYLSYELLSTLKPNEALSHIKDLTSKINSFPLEDAIYFWLGVLYLKLCHYEQAITYLKKAIDINMINDEYNYNLSLAMFKGKRPFRLKMNEIKQLLETLNTAITFNDRKEKYYYLKYIIYKDFYLRNGLNFPENTSLEHLIEKINKLPSEPIELRRLLATLGLPKLDSPIT